MKQRNYSPANSGKPAPRGDPSTHRAPSNNNPQLVKTIKYPVNKRYTMEEDHIEVTVSTDLKPTFRYTGEIGEDETREEAKERVLENARHDASIALAETAHEYDWVEQTNTQDE